ncbi:MAG TPA: biotin/lipoyl-containing protein [Pyrinomonadaceae bacterium]|nr:biotin/lipoyl-containing protein [Pyrinomonadaceae bacterium]
MKLHATIGENNHEVEIRRVEGKVFAKIDDREYELETSEPEPGVFLFKHEGKVYEAAVTSGDPTHVRVGKHEMEIRVVDPKRLRSAGSGADHADGAAEIRTAMPGKVVRVLVEAGAEVDKGDGVIIVEAMKMQNELKSPKAGVVKEVRAKEGATVAAGEILATIE